MAKKFIVILLITTLSSCLSVEFTKPQPSWCDNLSEFPKEMQGHFYNNEKDTIEIGTNFYKLISASQNPVIDVDIKSTKYLSDSLLLRTYRKNYFLNTKENNNWRVSIIKINNAKDITVYSALESEDKLMKNLKKVKDKTILKDESGKTTNIIVNPTKKEFQKLINSKLFVEYMVLKKVN